ncbi:transposase [Burkholderia pseudomallei]|nr:integrase core domain protein [Burkholderia pseudomallei MSHR5569]MBM5665306.1 transposase [Burkholderia pseudomallei]
MALPAVKHMDPVVGIDVHSVIVTPGLPPVFLPHPHVGFMLDLREYVEAAKGVIGSIAMTIAEDAVQDYLKDHPDDSKKLTDALNSLENQKKQAERDPWVAQALKLDREVSSIKGDVTNAVGAGVGMGGAAGRPIFVNGLMRATAGTHSFHVPGLHFPLGETFAPPDPLPSDDAESYMGSRTVLANNDPMSFLALPAMSCWAEGIEPPPHNGAHTTRTHVSMPSSVMLPIPVGRPVLVGGPPVMNMAAAAKGMFKAFQGSKWAKNLADKLHLKPGFLRCAVLKAEPVDVTTGEVVVQQNDFTVSGRLPLVWDRYYASQDRHPGAVGFGWQTPADIRLELMRNEDGTGAVAHFPDHATAFNAVPADDGWPARTYDWQHGHALYGDDGRMVLRTREGIEYGFVLPSRWRDAVAALDGDDSRLTLPIDRMADLNGNAWVFERDVYGGLVRLVEWKRDGRTGRVVECGTGSGLHAGLLTSLTLIDAEGNAHPLVSYEHDRERNLAAAIDAMAHPHHFEYAAGHRMVSHTSARGVSFYYSYQQDDDGVWRVDHAWGDNGLFDYRFVYDRARMETRVTNSLGHTTIMQMNERGMPVAEIDPLGGVTGYRYDAQGRASAMIDPAGRTTAWEYDAYGSLLVKTLPDGSAVRTEFDLDHRPVCMTLIGGRQWGYEWDTFGNLLAQSDPSGAISRYTYDEYGQLVEHTGPRGASTRFDYHPDGNFAAQIDALGHRTQYRYDARGYLVEAIDALGQQTQYEYDRNGHLTRAIEPGGREIHCAYDADGNLSRHRDPMGHVTQMEYSALGQVSRRLAPDGTTVEYRYDTEEQLIGVVNERSELYALERDALGRIVVETDYWGQARRYRYGAAGELLCSTDPLGQTVEYRYDWLGRIVQKRVPHPEQDEALQIDSFAYDRHGDLVLAENPSCRVEFGYDAAGRMIEERQGDDFTIASDYDEAGNRIERRTRLIAGGAVVAHTVRYTYDALDAVTSIQIDDTAPVVLGRDALGQICTEQLGAELRRELSYESGGQLASQRTLLTGTGELFASEYTYDANGELVEKRDSRGGIERFQYDPVGRVIAHLDPAGQLRRYLYDPAGDLLKTHIRERRTADAVAAAKAGTWVREGEYEGCYYAYDRVGTRECLAIEVDTSLPGLRVQQVLARLKEMRGLPASITVDNGPEFAGKVLDAWAYEAGVTLSFIRPGKPVENAYIESFNGRFRDECLNEHWFVSMRHAKQLIEEWRIEYNTERPHSSLGYLTPAQFARAHDAKQQFLTSDSNCSSD